MESIMFLLIIINVMNYHYNFDNSYSTTSSLSELQFGADAAET